jgi:iron complex transport system substrate-binding protein
LEDTILPSARNTTGRPAGRRWTHVLCFFSLATLVAAGPGGGSARADSAPPKRIVSLTVCADQLLLDLVDRDRIAALTYLAVDPAVSMRVEDARGLKGVHWFAEEVLALQPDLVIAQEYSATGAVDMLRRLGFRVVLVPLATDFEGMRHSIRIIADAVGEKARGEAVIDAFDKRIAAAQPQGPERPRALAYEVNSVALGDGSLIDAALEAAGFHNVARDVPLGPGGRLPLEDVVAHPPDLVVLANTPYEFRSTVGDNLRHPAFASVVASRPHVEVPMAQWLCATPGIAGAVEKLGAARRALLAAQQPPKAAPQ